MTLRLCQQPSVVSHDIATSPQGMGVVHRMRIPQLAKTLRVQRGILIIYTSSSSSLYIWNQAPSYQYIWIYLVVGRWTPGNPNIYYRERTRTGHRIHGTGHRIHGTRSQLTERGPFGFGPKNFCLMEFTHMYHKSQLSMWENISVP